MPEVELNRRVRTSERGNFKKCRQLWEWTSEYGHNLEPTRMNQHLAFGIAIHRGLEVWYNEYPHENFEFSKARAITAFIDECKQQIKIETDGYGEMDQEREQEFDDRIKLGRKMMALYINNTPMLDKGLTPTHVEVKGLVPVPGLENTLYQARLDLIVKDENDDYWVVDHKTAGRREEDMTFLFTDPQMTSYCWVAEHLLGVKVKGVIYSELFKRVPEEPKVLKSGKLSKDKSQPTTYDMYKQAIEDNGLDPADYEEYLQYLLANNGLDQYIRRTQIHYSEQDIEHQIENTRKELSEMTNPDLPIYPHQSKWNCGGCDFKIPCQMKYGGGDYEDLLNDPMYYRHRIREEE